MFYKTLCSEQILEAPAWRCECLRKKKFFSNTFGNIVLEKKNAFQKEVKTQQLLLTVNRNAHFPKKGTNYHKNFGKGQVLHKTLRDNDFWYHHLVPKKINFQVKKSWEKIQKQPKKAIFIVRPNTLLCIFLRYKNSYWIPLERFSKHTIGFDFGLGL